MQKTSLLFLSLFFLPFFFLACEETTVITELEINERQRLIIEEYLENKNITNFQKTASGIYYHVLTPGTGAQVPTTDAIVSVHYTGTVLYGNRFDSSKFRGEPFEFQVGTGRIVDEYDELGEPVFDGGVIQGWVEAVSLMQVGEETRFYIPSDLAYGTDGSGNIPGNAVIFFDIEVLEVK